MKKINIVTLYLLLGLFLYSCGDVGKTLRNEKVTNTDEFLVKKRQPLTLPPDYENLPEPGSKNLNKEDKNNKINKILKLPKNNIKKTGSSNVEQSIISQIRKWKIKKLPIETIFKKDIWI